MGAVPGELGGPRSHLEALSELCLDGEAATHTGCREGLGEADTKAGPPAVLCRVCAAAVTRQGTPTARV